MRASLVLPILLVAVAGTAEEPVFLADAPRCGSLYGVEPGDTTLLVQFCNSLTGVQEGLIPKVSVQGSLLRVYWIDQLARHLQREPEQAMGAMEALLENWRRTAQRACVTLEFRDTRETLILRGETSFSGDQFYIQSAP